jgi:hypothetical protein
MNITSLPGGGKVAGLSPELPLKRLVFSHGAILNTYKSEIPPTFCEMEEFFTQKNLRYLQWCL